MFRHKGHQVQRSVVGGFLVQLRNKKENLVSGLSVGKGSGDKAGEVAKDQIM